MSTKDSMAQTQVKHYHEHNSEDWKKYLPICGGVFFFAVQVGIVVYAVMAQKRKQAEEKVEGKRRC